MRALRISIGVVKPSACRRFDDPPAEQRDDRGHDVNDEHNSTYARFASRERAVALRVEPQGVSTLRAAVPRANSVRPAAPAMTSGRPFPWVGTAGLLPSRCARTSPLDDLWVGSGWHPAPTHSTSPHPPAAPDARAAPKATSARAGSTAAPVASLGGTSVAEPPALGTSRSSSRSCDARRAAGRCARRPTAIPPQAPRAGRGGLVGGSSCGGPGSWLTASAGGHHPSPTPSREEGAMPTPRPPVGGSEEVQARGSAFDACVGCPSRR